MERKKNAISRPSGWAANAGGRFYSKNSKYGVRYICKTCGKKALGLGDRSHNHWKDCIHAASSPATASAEALPLPSSVDGSAGFALMQKPRTAPVDPPPSTPPTQEDGHTPEVTRASLEAMTEQDRAYFNGSTSPLARAMAGLSEVKRYVSVRGDGGPMLDRLAEAARVLRVVPDLMGAFHAREKGHDPFVGWSACAACRAKLEGRT